MNNKGQNAVVKCNNQICLVLKGGKKGELVFWSEEKKSFRVYKDVNLHSPLISVVDIKLAPPQLRERHAKATMTVSNGQYVSFIFGTEKVFGTVIRGGRKATVLDSKGKYAYPQVPAHELTIEDKPIIEAPETLARYSVKKFKLNKELSDDTTAFSAALYLQVAPKKRAKLIAHVSNNGMGCPMQIDVADNDAYDEFSKKVKQTSQERGLSEFEVDEQFILWLGHYKQLNVSFDDYIGKPFNAESEDQEAQVS
ncbi:hypothetical protein OCT63_19735 [Vibrio sp. RW]|uniref:hypothetical protein n=1 Tax=Vibrio sp. RW TaxID=2998833 RepID=UPI0022CD757F|nr:hypothetical protein [Vibrio sp. RW]MDA0146462.1 hypothetical protein [Vibrio sp. RW]